MRRKLSDKFIERLKPAAKGQRTEIFDAVVPAFGLRVTDKGRKSWFVFYRSAGRLRRLTLGTYPALGLSEARKKAGKAGELVEAGRDPHVERTREKHRAEKRLSATFSAVVTDFIDRYAKRQTRSWRETQRIFDKYVTPTWGKWPITDIGRPEVVALLDRIEDEHGPVMADRTLAHIRKLFNWYATRQDEFRTPIVRGMARTKPKERVRKRALADDELRAVWQLLDGEDPKTAFGPALKVMLLTGQRRDEVAGMRRSEISGDVWTLPASRNKGKRDHIVPLAPAVRAIIDAQPKFTNGDYIFTTTGTVPFQGWTRKKNKLDAELLKLARRQAAERGDDPEKVKPLPHWTIHDLRRTAMKLMTQNGVSHFFADRVLGHAIPGVGGDYDVNDYREEKQKAVVKLAAAIDRIVTGKTADVVALDERRVTA